MMNRTHHAAADEDGFTPIRVQHFAADFEVIPDTGCDLAPCCLECPLPRCRYDDRALAGRWRRQSRNLGWLRDREAGLSVNAMAERDGVVPRRIYRGMEAARRFLEHEQAQPPVAAPRLPGGPRPLPTVPYRRAG